MAVDFIMPWPVTVMTWNRHCASAARQGITSPSRQWYFAFFLYGSAQKVFTKRSLGISCLKQGTVFPSNVKTYLGQFNGHLIYL